MKFKVTLLTLAAAVLGLAAATTRGTVIPNPAMDEQRASASGERTVVVAGGCFWGLQALFEHVKGVKTVTAGYSGGAAETANYQTVSDGDSGHAESVQIIYDPSRITYGQLLRVFFSVAHDPTEINRQGPDSGTQYRSAIFYANEDQEHIAQAYIKQLNQAKVFARPIATQVVALRAFYKAEAYHQDYAIHHPDNPYIVANDLPKVANLRKQLPELYIK
jgi:peptide-methionine (S)-S-oxide reductase